LTGISLRKPCVGKRLKKGQSHPGETFPHTPGEEPPEATLYRKSGRRGGRRVRDTSLVRKPESMGWLMAARNYHQGKSGVGKFK